MALSLFLGACKENEQMVFEDSGRVFFNERGTTAESHGNITRITEKNYSLTLAEFGQTEMEVGIHVELMGRISDHDRTFRAEFVRDHSTAVEDTHFTLHDGVMKAGEYWSQIPITLHRTPDLKEEAVTITLRIVTADDLDLGGGVDAGTEFEFFTLNVADFLLPPQFWPQNYFGDYSLNKYMYVISVLGITDFPVYANNEPTPVDGHTKFTVSELYAFQYELRQAYAAYRAEGNPPIWMDDNVPDQDKVEISF